jgi:hypothetical protein
MGVPTDAGFLCDEASMLGDMIKDTLCKSVMYAFEQKEYRLQGAECFFGMPTVSELTITVAAFHLSSTISLAFSVLSI